MKMEKIEVGVFGKSFFVKDDREKGEIKMKIYLINLFNEMLEGN